jgi:hypothetical protein
LPNSLDSFDHVGNVADTDLVPATETNLHIGIVTKDVDSDAKEETTRRHGRQTTTSQEGKTDRRRRPRMIGHYPDSKPEMVPRCNQDHSKQL